jgi:polysaccharide deacetylase family protein (PEP-CTERM system associated)
MVQIVNGLSIDVEEYFQVEAVASRIAPEAWTAWPSRVEGATRHLLDLLAAADCRATFFVLGWVAERHRGLIRAIAEAGHEVACHGYHHQHIARLTPAALRADLGRAKAVLEDITGRAVVGYRAPTFSIYGRTLWALDVLVEAGFEYDSSIFPVHHDRYGEPRAPRRPYVIERPAGRIVELPPLTARVAGANLPLAGGGYLRLMPVGAMEWAIRRMNRSGAPAVVYLHPWETEPRQPRLPLGRMGQWRHRVGLGWTVGKLRRLLARHRFGPLAPLARAMEARPPAP